MVTRYLVADLSLEQCENQPSFIPICVIYVTSRLHTDIKHCYVSITWNQSIPLQIDENMLIACGIQYDAFLTNSRGIYVLPFTDELKCQKLQNRSLIGQYMFVSKYYSSSLDLPEGVVSSGSELIPTCLVVEDRRHPHNYTTEFCLITKQDWLVPLQLNTWHTTSMVTGIGCSNQTLTDSKFVISAGFKYVSEKACMSLQKVVMCVLTGRIVNSTIYFCTHLSMSSIPSSWEEETLKQDCLDQHAINQVNDPHFHLILIYFHKVQCQSEFGIITSGMWYPV